MEFCPDLRTWKSDPISLQLIRQAEEEFAKVFTHMHMSLLQQILRGLVFVMADLDLYRRTKVPHVESIIVSRSMYIRELLLLPETIEASESEALIYQICRISCMLSLQVWLFADTGPKRNLPRRLVNMLLPVLNRSLTMMVHETLPEFYSWTVILGLMLAYEDFDNCGNETTMRTMVPFLESLNVKSTPAAWATLKHVVARFLWCKEDCAETAREAWEMACQMYTDGTCGGSPASSRLSSAVSVSVPARDASIG